MSDMLEIYISAKGAVRVLTKTICRKPGFFVHDYMSGFTSVYPIINYVSKVQVKDLVKLVPKIYTEDFNHLDAHCLIIENEAAELGIPKGQITLFHPSKFTKVVGWIENKPNRSKLAIKFPNGQFLSLAREEPLKFAEPFLFGTTSTVGLRHWEIGMVHLLHTEGL